MTKPSNQNSIAKNTLFLYFRMMFIMIVSLFTSRVILETLGINDYGIYQAVGGIVGFMSFLNNALSSGTSRFITFGLGKGNKDELRKTFSTVFIVHLALALLIVIIAETIGIWFLHNKMAIALDRMNAAIIVYHLSILTAIVSITQIPYTACITAHEKFNLYAYVSIVEVILKLTIVYMLMISSYDKLIVYAILLFVVTLLVQLYYRWYCNKHFNECKLRLLFDKNIFKPIAKYSSWNLLSNCTIALNNQGVLILINQFFSPTIVAARAISIQVDGIAKQFVQNFRTAANPQIIKQYAAGNLAESKRILLQTTNMSYYLMLIISLPICLTAEPLLNLWLNEVPEYTVIFLQLIVIQNLFAVFDNCFITGLIAKGQLKENALLSPTINAIRFAVIYFMFKAGYSPISLSIAGIITNAILGLIIKPILLIKIADYTWTEILPVFKMSLKVTSVACPIPVLLYTSKNALNLNGLEEIILIGGTSVICVGTTIWLIGLSKQARKNILKVLKQKLIKK